MISNIGAAMWVWCRARRCLENRGHLSGAGHRSMQTNPELQLQYGLGNAHWAMYADKTDTTVKIWQNGIMW